MISTILLLITFGPNWFLFIWFNLIIFQNIMFVGIKLRCLKKINIVRNIKRPSLYWWSNDMCRTFRVPLRPGIALLWGPIHMVLDRPQPLGKHDRVCRVIKRISPCWSHLYFRNLYLISWQSLSESVLNVNLSFNQTVTDLKSIIVGRRFMLINTHSLMFNKQTYLLLNGETAYDKVQQSISYSTLMTRIES